MIFTPDIGHIYGTRWLISNGGNDSQLLLALPTFSPAGIVAVIGILMGVAVGLILDNKLQLALK